MSLIGSATQAIRGVTEKILRNAIAYAICGICALAILILATSAAVLALIPLVGAVYALLIVAGVFLLVIVGTMIWLQAESPQQPRAMPIGAASVGAAATANPDATQRQMLFAQLAMIIEAVALGYSLSRKR
jgi:O-antigen ligase